MERRAAGGARGWERPGALLPALPALPPPRPQVNPRAAVPAPSDRCPRVPRSPGPESRCPPHTPGSLSPCPPQLRGRSLSAPRPPGGPPHLRRALPAVAARPVPPRPCGCRERSAGLRRVRGRGAAAERDGERWGAMGNDGERWGAMGSGKTP
ncbi:uncharacterized protein LOC130263543 [Oenanthe melanoleuca]|uniref:uncharacterized protein LOC130263543 n=1 Tax=Oenanthe melanoleuca TaxID=2939378 RepID=UPI0024C10CBE|nr:uncharacterized protein LOC130263543 [Oenanthe melanoleuca]